MNRRDAGPGTGSAAAAQEREESEGQRFEAFLDELTAAFVRAHATDIDHEIEAWLERLAANFNADRSSIAELTPDGAFVITHLWARPGHEPSPKLGERDLPWLAAQLARGEMVVMSGVDDLPVHAVGERAVVERDGIKAYVAIPLAPAGKTIGAVGITCIRQSSSWPPVMLQRLRVIGTVFANALARKQAVLEYLQLSRTLEHAGRVATVGQLALAFAHDIKQPLSASLTNAQTAIRLLEAGEPDLAEVRAALADIADDNRRAGDIVNEWRRFLRREEPRLEALPLSDLFGTVIKFVAPEARSQAIAVAVDVALALAVLADRVQLQQVLVNLMLNAFDAVAGLPAGARRVVLGAAAAPAGRIVVSVRDTGAGVPDELLANLYEPFVSGKPQGLGIGLAIAQAILTAHGSRLVYSKAPDGGAVFSFSLPACGRESHAA